MNLQNLFVTWYNLQKWFELFHATIPLNRNVFHYVTVKQYSSGRLQYIKTERKFIVKSIVCHMERAGGYTFLLLEMRNSVSHEACALVGGGCFSKDIVALCQYYRKYCYHAGFFLCLCNGGKP